MFECTEKAHCFVAQINNKYLTCIDIDTIEPKVSSYNIVLTHIPTEYVDMYNFQYIFTLHTQTLHISAISGVLLG